MKNSGMMKPPFHPPAMVMVALSRWPSTASSSVATATWGAGEAAQLELGEGERERRDERDGAEQRAGHHGPRRRGERAEGGRRARRAR